MRINSCIKNLLKNLGEKDSNKDIGLKLDNIKFVSSSENQYHCVYFNLDGKEHNLRDLLETYVSGELKKGEF